MTAGSESPAAPPSTPTQQVQAEFGPDGTGPEEVMDERVRKRLALGLSPRRPTAQVAPLRPPTESNRYRLKSWILVGLVAAIALATILLVLARVADSPTDWPSAVAGLFGRPPAETTRSSADISTVALAAFDGERSTTHYDFALEEASIPPAERADVYVMGPVVENGVYRMEIGPGNVAWVVPGPACPSSSRVVAATAVDPARPDSHTGLLGRYQDDGNFYFFTVDGQGSFEVLLLRDGAWQPVASGLHENVRPAGELNTLALTDDGRAMRLVANGELLHTIDAPQLPAGKAGFGGRAEETMARVDFANVELTTACQ